MKKLIKLFLTLTLLLISFQINLSNAQANVPDHAFEVTQYENTSLPIYDFVFDMEKEGQDANIIMLLFKKHLMGKLNIFNMKAIIVLKVR